MMLNCLNVPVSLDAVGPIQSAAMMALIDCYDRKIDREFFGGVAATSLALHAAMGRLYTVSMLREMAKEKEFKANPEGEIENLIKGLVSHATARQKDLSRLVTRLVQCPTEEDSIH